jgi:ABC-type multidrug transport system fused ATPase/permease subunit
MPLVSLIQVGRNYWSLISPARRQSVIYFLVLCVISAAFESISIGALYPFIDSLSSSKQPMAFSGVYEILPSTLPSHLITIGLGSLLAMLTLVSTICRCAVIRFQNVLTANIATDIACSLFTAIQKSPYQWHLNNGTNRVMHCITQDVEVITVGLNSGLTLLSSVIVSLVLSVALLSIEPVFTAFVMVLLTVYYVFVFYSTRAKIKRYAQLSRYHYAESYKTVLESVEGIKDVIINDLSSLNSARFKYDFLKGRIASAEIDINAQTPRYLIEGFIVILVTATLLYLIIADVNIAAFAAALTTVLLGFYKLLQPVQSCFSAVSKIQVAQPSLQDSIKILEGMNDVSKISSNIIQQKHTSSRIKLSNSEYPYIEFLNVTHTYPSSSTTALDNITFSINKGDKILVMGPSGSGKTTLINTILGLLPPTSGEVLVDHISLYNNSNQLRLWHQQIGHVPQDITVYSGTFASNIAIGIEDDKINLDRLKYSAIISAIDQYIQERNHGFFSDVGHRGNQLSGGQRQRIAIARAIYKQPQLIVLDEPTSALDIQTASQIVSHLSTLHRPTSTVIMNSHQFCLLAPDMKTLIMHKGRIIYYGHHSGFKYYDKLDLLSIN